MAKSITPIYANEREYYYGTAKQSKYYNESDMNNVEDSLIYAKIISSIGNKDNVHFDEKLYNTLYNPETKLSYIADMYYGDYESAEFKERQEQYYQQYEYDLKKRFYDNQHDFVKFLGNLGSIPVALTTGVVSVIDGLYNLGKDIVGLTASIWGGNELRNEIVNSSDGLVDLISGTSTTELKDNYYTYFTEIGKDTFGGNVMRVATDATYTIGQMAPMIITAIATGGASVPADVAKLAGKIAQGVYYASMAGNTVQQTISENPEISSIQALLYTGATTGVEYLTEKLMGDAIFGKGFLNPVTLTSKMSSTFGKSLAHLGLTAAGEAMEEMTAEVLDAGLYAMIIQKDPNLTIQDVLYAGFLGGLVGFLGEGFGALTTKKQGVLGKWQSYLTLKELDFNSTQLKDTLNKNSEIVKLQTKYHALTMEEIKTQHTEEYESALSMDQERDSIIAKYVVAIEQIGAVLGKQTVENAEKILEMSQKDVADRARYSDIYETDSFSKESVAAELYTKLHPGSVFVIKREYTETEHAIQKSLKEMFPNINFVIGNKGGKRVNWYGISVAEGMVFLDAEYLNTASFDSIANNLISHEIIHDLQRDGMKLSEVNMDLLDRMLKDKFGKEINYDNIPTTISMGIATKGNKKAIRAEKQAKILTELFLYNNDFITSIAYRDFGLFEKLYFKINRLFRNQKTTTRHGKLKVQALGKILNRYRKQLAKSVTNDSDLKSTYNRIRMSKPQQEQYQMLYLQRDDLVDQMMLTKVSLNKFTQTYKEAHDMLMDSRADTRVKKLDTSRILDPTYYSKEFLTTIGYNNNPWEFENLLNDKLQEYNLMYVDDLQTFVTRKNMYDYLDYDKLTEIESDIEQLRKTDRRNTKEIERLKANIDAWASGLTMVDLFTDEFFTDIDYDIADTVPVSVDTDMSQTDVLGGYDIYSKNITIKLSSVIWGQQSTDVMTDLIETISHEVTHAISHKQGLYLGYSPEGFRKIFRNVPDKVVNLLTQQLHSVLLSENKIFDPSYDLYELLYVLTSGEMNGDILNKNSWGSLEKSTYIALKEENGRAVWRTSDNLHFLERYLNARPLLLPSAKIDVGGRPKNLIKYYDTLKLKNLINHFKKTYKLKKPQDFADFGFSDVFVDYIDNAKPEHKLTVAELHHLIEQDKLIAETASEANRTAIEEYVIDNLLTKDIDYAEKYYKSLVSSEDKKLIIDDLKTKEGVRRYEDSLTDQELSDLKKSVEQYRDTPEYNKQYKKALYNLIITKYENKIKESVPHKQAVIMGYRLSRDQNIRLERMTTSLNRSVNDTEDITLEDTLEEETKEYTPEETEKIYQYKEWADKDKKGLVLELHKMFKLSKQSLTKFLDTLYDDIKNVSDALTEKQLRKLVNGLNNLLILAKKEPKYVDIQTSKQTKLTIKNAVDVIKKNLKTLEENNQNVDTYIKRLKEAIINKDLDTITTIHKAIETRVKNLNKEPVEKTTKKKVVKEKTKETDVKYYRQFIIPGEKNKLKFEINDNGNVTTQITDDPQTYRTELENKGFIDYATWLQKNKGSQKQSTTKVEKPVDNVVEETPKFTNNLTESKDNKIEKEVIKEKSVEPATTKTVVKEKTNDKYYRTFIDKDNKNNTLFEVHDGDNVYTKSVKDTQDYVKELKKQGFVHYTTWLKNNKINNRKLEKEASSKLTSDNPLVAKIQQKLKAFEKAGMDVGPEKIKLLDAVKNKNDTAINNLYHVVNSEYNKMFGKKDAQTKEKTHTYTMKGTTGEYKVENLTKKQAEDLKQNNEKLGYEGTVTTETKKEVVKEKLVEPTKTVETKKENVKEKTNKEKLVEAVKTKKPVKKQDTNKKFTVDEIAQVLEKSMDGYEVVKSESVQGLNLTHTVSHSEKWATKNGVYLNQITDETFPEIISKLEKSNNKNKTNIINLVYWYFIDVNTSQISRNLVEEKYAKTITEAGETLQRQSLLAKREKEKLSKTVYDDLNGLDLGEGEKITFENKDFERAMIVANIKLENVSRETEKLRKENEKLEKEREAQTKLFEQLEAENTKLQNLYTDVINEKESLDAERKSLSDEIAKLKKESKKANDSDVKKLEKEIKKLEKELEAKSDSKIKALETVIEEQKQHIADLRKQQSEKTYLEYTKEISRNENMITAYENGDLMSLFDLILEKSRSGNIEERKFAAVLQQAITESFTAKLALAIEEGTLNESEAVLYLRKKKGESTHKQYQDSLKKPLLSEPAKDRLYNALNKANAIRHVCMLFNVTSWMNNWTNNVAVNVLDNLSNFVSNSINKMIDSRHPEYKETQLNYGSKIDDNVNDWVENIYNTPLAEGVKTTLAQDLIRVNKYDKQGSKYNLAHKNPETTDEILKKARDLADKNKGLHKIYNAIQGMIRWGLEDGPFGDLGFTTRHLLKSLKKILSDPENLNRFRNTVINKLYTKYNIKNEQMLREILEYQSEKNAKYLAVLDNDKISIIETFMEDEINAQLIEQECVRMATDTFFKSDSRLSLWFVNLAKNHPLIAFPLSTFIPFPKIGINIFKTIYRYSPLGFIDSFGRYKQLVDTTKMDEKVVYKNKGSGKVEIIKEHNLDPWAKAKVSKQLAQASVGTVGFIAGLLMGLTGLIDIEDDDYLGVCIRIADLRLSLSTIAPGLSPIALGATITASLKNNQNVFENTMNLLYDQTALGFVDNIFRFTDAGNFLETYLHTFMGQFVPAQLKAITKVLDPNLKDKTGNFFEKAIKTLGSYIPGVSYAVPNRIDPYTGKNVTRYGFDFSNPGTLLANTILSLTPLDGELDVLTDAKREMERLGLSTGGIGDSYTFNNKTYKVSKSSNAGRVKGQYINNEITKLLQSTKYNKLSDEEKRKAIRSILSNATEIAKITFWTELGNYRVFTSSDEYNKYKDYLYSTQNIKKRYTNYKGSKYITV